MSTDSPMRSLSGNASSSPTSISRAEASEVSVAVDEALDALHQFDPSSQRDVLRLEPTH